MLVQSVKVNGYRGHDLARIMGSRGWNGAEAGASECQREYKWVDPICLPQTTCHSTHTYARARVLLHMSKTEEEKVGVLGLSPQSACRDFAFVARWGAIIIHDPPTKADGQPEAASPSLLCVWWTGDEGRRQDHDPSTWVSHRPQTQ